MNLLKQFLSLSPSAIVEQEPEVDATPSEAGDEQCEHAAHAKEECEHVSASLDKLLELLGDPATSLTSAQAAKISMAIANLDAVLHDLLAPGDDLTEKLANPTIIDGGEHAPADAQDHQKYADAFFVIVHDPKETGGFDAWLGQVKQTPNGWKQCMFKGEPQFAANHFKWDAQFSLKDCPTPQDVIKKISQDITKALVIAGPFSSHDAAKKWADTSKVTLEDHAQ